MKFLFQFCVWMVVATPLLAQKKNKIEFTQYKLDNGLQVILHKDNSTPIVAVSIMYHVGSKDENPNRTGFAHFFEHLLFEGSENIGRGKFARYVEDAGGTLNANTSSDRTYYYEILPSNQLELGLWLESERLMHAKVDNEGIETQREVVKEEKRLRVDNQPYGRMFEEIFKAAYTVHTYQWVPIGSMEHLDAATEEDYVGFYKTFYVPNNAILSIAGDIDIEHTKKLIQAYFGPIPKGKEVPRPTAVEPQKTEEVRAVAYDNIQLPAVIQAYHIPGVGAPDYYVLELLSTLLSDGESSRLHRALVDQQQKALFAGNFSLNLEHPGLVVNFAMANMGVSLDELEIAMDAEIERIKTELITDEEMQKLRNQIENSFVSSHSTMAGIAEALANYQMYYGNANLVNTKIDIYNKITKEDIKRVANTYLNKTNRVVLHYLPHPTN